MGLKLLEHIIDPLDMFLVEDRADIFEQGGQELPLVQGTGRGQKRTGAITVTVTVTGTVTVTITATVTVTVTVADSLSQTIAPWLFVDAELVELLAVEAAWPGARAFCF
jgi:hypothetical protein